MCSAYIINVSLFLKNIHYLYKELKYLSKINKLCRSLRYENIAIPKIMITMLEHQILVQTICQWNVVPSNIQLMSDTAKYKIVLQNYLCNL